MFCMKGVPVAVSGEVTLDNSSGDWHSQAPTTPNGQGPEYQQSGRDDRPERKADQGIAGGHEEVVGAPRREQLSEGAGNRNEDRQGDPRRREPLPDDNPEAEQQGGGEPA